jgi:hypothetical protein
MRRLRLAFCMLSLAAMPLLAGCGTFRETFPERSATEQFLISKAVDRAAEDLPTYWMDGKAIYLDATNLDCIDRPYVVQRLRDLVLSHGGRLVEDRESAEVALEVASGGLSMDKGHWLLGLPELPLPIPFADETLVFPEVPLFKLITYAGKSKLLVSAVNARDGTQARDLPLCLGKSHHRYLWLLFVGPFTLSDLHKDIR